MHFVVSHASDGKKKLVIEIFNNDKKKTLKIGQLGASDYTIHKDFTRKQRYINRHMKRENWTKSGMFTKGYWAKHLLWNKKTLEDSIKDIADRDNIIIHYKKN